MCRKCVGFVAKQEETCEVKNTPFCKYVDGRHGNRHRQLSEKGVILT